MEISLPSVSVASLVPALWPATALPQVDVRRQTDFEALPRLTPGALRRGPALFPDELRPTDRAIVVHCACGLAVSQSACRVLHAGGFNATSLEGGYAAWTATGQPFTRHVALLGAGPSRWFTRERLKIDRIARPRLVRRFVDPQAEFFDVPPPR